MNISRLAYHSQVIIALYVFKYSKIWKQLQCSKLSGPKAFCKGIPEQNCDRFACSKTNLPEMPTQVLSQLVT